jgi:iron complex outermembrane receptor protein
LSEDTNVFFNYGKGFDTPTLTEAAYRTTSTADGGLNLALKPAKSDHYEIGFKTRIGETQRLDVSYFVINTKNEIVVSENVGGRAVFTNAATTQRNGIEVAHSAKWSEELSSYLALTTLNARFKDSFKSEDRTISAGNYIPGTMDKQLFAELVWKPSSLKGLSAGVEWVHQGKIWVNDLNVAATESASVFNIRLGWDRQYGPWAIKSYLRVDNITDKDYVGSVIANDGGSRFYEPAPGLQVGVGLSATYSF